MTYEEFINSILASRPNLRFTNSACHHIKPKCLGGTWDDGYVYLTHSEHFTAHILLVEENPDNLRLRYALNAMRRFNKEITPEEYEKAKILSSVFTCKGIKRSSYTKKLLSDSQRGVNNSFYGRKHTDETKKIIGIANRDKVISEETRLRISIAKSGSRNPMYGIPPWNKGNHLPTEVKLRISESSKNRKSIECICSICNSEFFGANTSKFCPDCREKYSKKQLTKLAKYSISAE